MSDDEIELAARYLAEEPWDESIETKIRREEIKERLEN